MNTDQFDLGLGGIADCEKLGLGSGIVLKRLNYASSCFYSASTGGANTNTAPDGGISAREI